ncbi:three-helix bundle dimerization domain-containing protein [Nonomuraea sp. NPDC050022]|uniref:three-helix bundle dimerization domain-containing protein n=1 Tax=Nonomuraea sp. NPDC050022 TaxID=3364358 RepID=UPI0037A81B67
MSGDTLREEQAIRRTTDHLVQVFAGTHSAEHVESVMRAAYRRFDGLPVRDFVPVMVERIARGELTARVEAPAPTEPAPTEPAPAKPTPAEAAPPKAAASPAAAPSGKPADVRPETTTTVAQPAAVLAKLPSRKVLLPIGLGVAVVVVAAVVVVNLGKTEAPPPAPPLTVVRGVIGSEKKAFFEDPQVVRAFADEGVKVEIESAGSRQIATSVDLSRFDFAFPSSAPAGEFIQRRRKVSTKYTPFSSPMAIATFQPIADLLTKAGVVKQGPVPTFSIGRYLELVTTDTKWDQLTGNSDYRVDKNILISTTDPRTSNSAAMYLAITSYVANGSKVVHGATAEKNVLPLVTQLFTSQGYTDNTSEGPFNEYLTVGMGPSPMVWIYEAQFVDAATRGQIKPGMVLMYPSPTVMSKHTLVPLNASGDRVGRLLSTDSQLQRLAAEHGFRSADAADFAKVAADHKVSVATDLIDVVDIPSYDTLENLLDSVGKSYG